VKNIGLLAMAVGIACGSSRAHAAPAEDAGANDAALDGGKRVSGPRSAADGAARDGATAAPDAALPPPTHAVGKACAKDADCASGLVCLTAATDSLGAGGPPGGLCTVSCAKNGQTDCNGVDTGSVCASDPNGNSSYCYETCAFGVAAGAAPKCHDRLDVACAPTQTGVGGICAPTCRGDFDCSGRVCDPTTGLCANSVTGTLPVGSACDPNASTTSCIGGCETLGSGAPTRDNSFCTSTCAFGRAGGCGQSPTVSGPLPVACVFKFSATEFDGDLGECGQLCDCDSDCRNPGFVCNENALAESAGHPGACVPRLTFDGVTAGMPCGEGSHSEMASDGGKLADGATPTDASSDGALTPISATGACSCRTAGGASQGGHGFALLVAAVGVLGLRRRNTGHTRPKR